MSALTLALDAFIELAEKIVDLEKTKKEDNKQVFKEIIEPLFLQLQPVAEDYMEIFRKAHELVDYGPNTELLSVIDQIRKSREKMQLARTTIQTMAWQMIDSYKDHEIQIFAMGILKFFDTSSRKGTYSMQLTARLGRAMKNLEDKSDSGDLVNYIIGKRGDISSHWESISLMYAGLKIRYLSSPSLLNKKK